MLDKLTGSYNRRHISEFGGKEFDRSIRHRRTALCILMIDVDHFKQVNDQFEHTVGDQALIFFS